MIVHRYESSLEEVTNTQGPVIFLAGPTVRGHQPLLQPSWRFAAIDYFKEIGFKGSLVVPEFTDIKESDKGRFDIPLWEYNGLKRADCILFWIPRTRELIGLTTNWEHGYWVGRNIRKVIYGRPEESYRNAYIDIMWNEIHRELNATPHIYTTLEDTIIKSIERSISVFNLRTSILNAGDTIYQGASHQPLL